MLEFAWPWMMALFALAWLWRWLLPPARSRMPAVRLPLLPSTSNPAPVSARPTSNLRLGLAACAWTLLVLACMRPTWVDQPRGIAVTGRDLMLAIDISGSMGTPDLESGVIRRARIVVVKELVSDFVERRIGDRLGLIVFGTEAFLASPLTYDRELVGALVEESELGFAGDQTALGDAITLATKHLSERPADTRVLILLSDGANTSGENTPTAAAARAAERGVKIHTIGVGADQFTVRRWSGVQSASGADELDEASLREIADRTGGSYLRARSIADLKAIYRQIDELEPIYLGDRFVHPRSELYVWPLGAGLLLVCLLFLGDIGIHKRPRLARLAWKLNDG